MFDFDRVVRPNTKGRRVHERFVRKGDTVAVVCKKVTYGRALLTDDGFNVFRRSRDALQLTVSGKSWQDYLAVIGCYLLHDMVEDVEKKDKDVPRHAEVFPEILSGECAVKHGDPIADPVRRQAYKTYADVLATSVGPELMALAKDDPRCVAAITGAECVLAASFLECVTLLSGVNWRGEGCLVDLKYVPDDLMPAVRESYFDMREKAKYIASATGGAVFPLFPRLDDLQFHFFVHGLELDASPLRRHVRVDGSNKNGRTSQAETLPQVLDRELLADPLAA